MSAISKAVPDWFDNGPVVRMGDEMLSRVRQLGFQGCEVLQCQLDGLRATIFVDGPGRLSPQFRDGDFAGVLWGAVRVVWRVECDEGAGADS